MFDEIFSYRKLADMGFQLAWMNRGYMPVKLKVTFTDQVMGSNPYNFWAPTILYGPEDMNATECDVLACQYGGGSTLFIKTPEDEDAYAYNPAMGRIKLIFDAEAFAYIMENASRANKLAFFRNAVLPSMLEANKFLAIIDNSPKLSEKDHNRAWTWIQQIANGKTI